jgi:hypothetical protein
MSGEARLLLLLDVARTADPERPLSALTGKQPAVCRAMETVVSEIVDAPVRECCDRSSQPKCCFEIATG